MKRLNKLESRTEVCLFVRYLKGTRGGIFYSPKDKKVFVSTHATFLENDYIIGHKPRSKVVLEELMGSLSSSQLTKVVDLRENEEMPSLSRSVRVTDRRDKEEEEEQTTISNQNIPEPRRSGRIIRLPRRYKTNVIVSDINDDDPASFKEAMISSEKDKWQEAMN